MAKGKINAGLAAFLAKKKAGKGGAKATPKAGKKCPTCGQMM